MNNALSHLAAFSSITLAAGVYATAAHAVVCTVGAYETYVYATTQARPPYDRTLYFTCASGAWEHMKAEVEADPERGLICTGATSERDNEETTYRMELFATPGASINTRNGWRITDYDVGGGEITRAHRRDSLILFDFDILGQGTAFTRELRSITLSKDEGHCGNVLSEALDWTR